MKIMVCYDGSKQSQNALAVARKYAKAFNASILITTALEGDPKEQLGKMDKAEKVLEEAKKFYADDDFEYDTKMLPANNMNVAENLVLLAKELNVEKIIMGVQKKSKIGKFFFGSTVQHVILTAPCPVVAVK